MDKNGGFSDTPVCSTMDLLHDHYFSCRAATLKQTCVRGQILGLGSVKVAMAGPLDMQGTPQNRLRISFTTLEDGLSPMMPQASM